MSIWRPFVRSTTRPIRTHSSASWLTKLCRICLCKSRSTRRADASTLANTSAGVTRGRAAGAGREPDEAVPRGGRPGRGRTHRPGRGRPRDGAGRPGRGGEDDAAAPLRRAATADRGHRDGVRVRHPDPARTDPGGGQLHAAAVRALRGSHRSREPRPVRRPAGRRRARAGRGVPAAARLHRAGPVHRPAGGPAVRRDEAEARARLRPDPRPEVAAPGRAERRGRSDLAARAVADGVRPR